MRGYTLKDMAGMGLALLALFCGYLFMVFLTGAFITFWMGGEFISGGVENLKAHYVWLTTGEFPDGR